MHREQPAIHRPARLVLCATILLALATLISCGEGYSPADNTDYLPINDSEYPYAGIPRIVIETRDLRKVKDRETKIPAKMQIYGTDAPTSEVMDLTIKGRGNTSWTLTHKRGYKIELDEKESLFGMPKNRDWALIASYADKTLMKNYLSYQIASRIGMPYSPKCTFVEFYLNREYQGVYLLTETIKIGKNRVNIPETKDSYLVEIDTKYKEDEQVIFTKTTRPFRIHSPKNASKETLDILKRHLNHIEAHIDTNYDVGYDTLSRWFDLEAYAMHHWVQEYTKNPDAAFYTSIFFTWVDGGPIKMGPVWDFDLSFGGALDEEGRKTSGWKTKTHYWSRFLFRNEQFEEYTNKFWDENKDAFVGIPDTIETLRKLLEKPARNNFKRWNILKSTENHQHIYAYDTYDEAVDSLKNWAIKRYEWINKYVQKKLKK